MRKKILCIGVMAVVVLLCAMTISSCKSCNKTDAAKTVAADSSSRPVMPQAPLNSINLPHADTALTSVLTKITDDIFDASKKRDYNKLASYIVYRGPDMKRFGYDVFNAKNAYERGVVRMTSDVFNKWNNSSETRQYARAFSLAQQDGRDMTVLEVIFISKKGVTREFFGFLPFASGEFKLVDVTSNLGVQ